MTPSPIRLKIFKFALYLFAILAFVPLGVVHIFFQDFYFEAIHYELYDPNDPVQTETVQLIGAFFIALSVAAVMVGRNILGNRDLLIVILLSLAMTGMVVAYTVIIGVAPFVVWFNTVTPYTILLLLMLWGYPWRAAAEHLAKAKNLN